jgi:hypothetical protein
MCCNCYNNMYHNIIYLLSQILYRNLIHSCFSIEIEINLLTFRWSFTNYTNYTIKKFFSEWFYYNLWHKVSWKFMAFVWWCTLKIIGMLVPFFYFMDILEEKTHIYIDFQTCMNIYKTYHIFLFLFMQIFNQ